MIWDRVLGRGTHQDHISWIIGQSWRGNTRCIVHKKVFIGSQDGVTMIRVVRPGDDWEEDNILPLAHTPLWDIRCYVGVLYNVFMIGEH